jgi:hypothetical protein
MPKTRIKQSLLLRNPADERVVFLRNVKRLAIAARLVPFTATAMIT